MLKISNLTKLYNIVIGVNDMSVDDLEFRPLNPMDEDIRFEPTKNQSSVMLKFWEYRRQCPMKRLAFLVLDILKLKTIGLNGNVIYGNARISS